MARSKRSARRGFTLMEIMVAMVAGVITVTVVYSLSRGTSRVLAEQHKVSQTQTALRLAMEQIRTDIERAGFLGTPNSDAEQTCNLPPSRLQAVIFQDDFYTANIPHAAEHSVEADRLVLIGNYMTSGAYLLTGIADNTGSTVAFQPTWQSFRRDFGVPFNQAAYDRVFADNRWVHITTLQGQHFFTQVRSRGTSGAGPNIGINPALTPGGLCTVGLADGATIAPINAIEYAILNPRAPLPAGHGGQSAAELSALLGNRTGEDDATRNAIEGLPSVLVRREVDPLTGAVVAGTTRVVLEYAVEFDLGFDVDTTSGPNSNPTIRRLTGSNAQAVLGPAGSAPQGLRTIEVRLSARTPGAEPNQRWIARTDPNTPLTRFFARDQNPAQGLPSSRVRTLVETITLPNVAAADLP